MQKYHRNRHRLIWLIVAPAALILFIFAITHRPQWPEMESLPGTEFSAEPAN
ncbi:MAG: hypothetical protein ACI9R3_002440 [Verrucomicrobiales bacterium]|jgi:hypothetical protein